jgi:tetratricopeptide (TPR) repeat protein
MEMDLDIYRRNLAIADRRLAAAEAGEEDARHTPDDLRRIRNKLVKEIASREIEMLRLRADRFPNDLSYRLDLGIRLAEADQLDEAIVDLQQARKDPRLLWKAAMHLGLSFKRRNNWRLAQRNLEEAMAQVPPGEEESRKEILYQLAVGSAESGELQKAIDLGHDLANIDFGFRDIGKLLDEWHDRLQEV